MGMIFVFIDGFGLGEKDKDKNPFCTANTPNLKNIFEKFSVYSVDTKMGINGLPQSATGQTAIFTGVNAAKVLGRHLSGQPTQTLKEIIEDSNLFLKLTKRGMKVTNSNVYRCEYLETMLDTRNRKFRPSVTSVMSLSAGVRLRTVDDYKRGLGVYHDITGEMLVESGCDVRKITASEAAIRLKDISKDFDFTLFEYFMTDIIGHKMDMAEAKKRIEVIDTFLGELVRIIDLKKDIIFITSDHGNIEDLSVKTHTYNNVPAVVISEHSKLQETKIKTLTEITSYIIRTFELEEGN